MKERILIKRYALGLVSSLKNEVEYRRVSQELSGFASLLERHDRLGRVLHSPFLPKKKKARLVREVLSRAKASSKTERFVHILIDNNRLKLLSGIMDILPLFWNEKKGIVSYEVYSAAPLNKAQKERLKRKVEAMEKRPVALSFSLDPALLGGIALKKGNIIYDVSLRGQLAKLKEKMIEG
ncbi:MAG: ATP synthase F1 subunit delta [Candidatus Aminicenantales bacterium]